MGKQICPNCNAMNVLGAINCHNCKWHFTGGDTAYGFSTITTTYGTWQDGFAEGYSRGWIECWDYIAKLKPENKLSTD